MDSFNMPVSIFCYQEIHKTTEAAKESLFEILVHFVVNDFP